WQTARIAVLGGTETHNLHTGSDTDWWKTNLTQSGPLHVLLNPAAKLWVYRDNGSGGVTEVSYSASATAYLADLPANTYYVATRSADGNPLASYTALINKSWEPNNTWQTASPFPLGGSQTQDLPDGNDTDWVKFANSGTSDVTVTLSKAVKLWLYRIVNGSPQQVYVEASSTGRTSTLAAGDYCLAARSATGAAVGSFTIGISAGYEPDNTWQTATPFTFGTTQIHDFVDGNDHDWMRFSLTSTRDVTVKLSVATKLWLYQNVGGVLKEVYAEAGSTGRTTALGAGDYYVATQSADGAALDSYSLTLNAGYEPDNTWQTATPFTFGTTQIHDFADGNDLDWVSFSLTATRQVTVALAPATKLWLYRKSGSSLTTLTHDPSTTSRSATLTAGDYFAATKSASGAALSSYTLSISTGYEPNNTWQTATPFELGSTQTHDFPDGNDFDWVKFTVPAMSYVTVTLSTAVKLWLYRNVGGSLTQAYYVASSTGRTDLLLAGDYVLATRSTGGAVAAYTLTIGAVARAVRGDRWLTELVVTSSHGAQPLYFGVGAEQAWPAAAGQAAFVGPQGARAVLELRSGVSGGTWELEVPAAAGEDVVVSWPDLARSLPEGYGASLSDAESGRRVSLSQTGSYAFRAGPGPRRLRLEVGPRRGVRLGLGSVTAVPTRGRQLGVTWEQTVAGTVRLAVLGLNGTVVKRVERTGEAGTNTWLWDGTDQAGRRAPAGTYRVLVVVTGDDGEQARAERVVSVR
ncbi:MAG: hypothetical protein HYU66_29220, partial [Armatimonadetes bacterium]|nr:hypothetical protein [Armatimonadota bacterium]